MTASPLLSSEKTASRPPASLVGSGLGASSNLAGGGGGPGGGGGGGGAPAPPVGAGAAPNLAGLFCCTDLMASWAETPLGFQGMPCGKVFLMYSISSLKTV